MEGLLTMLYDLQASTIIPVPSLAGRHTCTSQCIHTHKKNIRHWPTLLCSTFYVTSKLNILAKATITVNINFHRPHSPTVIQILAIQILCTAWVQGACMVWVYLRLIK